MIGFEFNVEYNELNASDAFSIPEFASLINNDIDDKITAPTDATPKTTPFIVPDNNINIPFTISLGIFTNTEPNSLIKACIS